MMKHVQPRANLPSVHVPPVTNAMPVRSPRGGGRNMTGIYLGMEADQENAPVPKTIPPLSRSSRGRGKPRRAKTPTEQRRYYQMSSAATKQWKDKYDVYHFYANSAYFSHGLFDWMAIPYLPAMPRSRYPLVSPQRMVELHRIKEERRGFTGQPLKKKPVHTEDIQEMPMPPPPPSTDDQVTIWDMTKQTQRHFTATTNSGVTRLEHLNPVSLSLQDRDAFSQPIPNQVAQEVHRLANSKQELIGLVECYKKVCKGNINMLHSLLPTKQLHQGNQKNPVYKYTGFTVKSYRNPNQAEIIASFPPQEPRPRTVIGTTSQGRGYVPNPYFFKSYNPPRSSVNYYNSQGYGTQLTPLEDGSGVSRGLPKHFSGNPSPRTHSTAPPLGRHANHSAVPPIGRSDNPTNIPATPTSHHPAAVEASSEQGDVLLQQAAAVPPGYLHTGDTYVEISLPGVDQATEGESTIIDPAASVADDQDSTPPPGGENTNQNARPDTASRLSTMEAASPEVEINVEEVEEGIVMSLERRPSGFEIVIGLEDECGDQKPVEIDETDEVLQQPILPSPVEEEPRPKTPVEELEPPSPVPLSPVREGPKRRVSITERVLKSKNTEQQMQSITEDAESRKRELQDLLTEHAQLVQEVETMEGTAGTPGSDKENESFSSHPQTLASANTK